MKNSALTPSFKLVINISDEKDRILFEEVLDRNFNYSIFNQTNQEVIYELNPQLIMSSTSAKKYLTDLLDLFESFNYLEPYFEEMGNNG